MSNVAQSRVLLIQLISLVLLGSCAPAPRLPASSPTVEAPRTMLAPQTVAYTPLAVTLTLALSPTPTPPPPAPIAVEVLAKGDIFLRRGPDMAFNPIAVLERDEVVTATGRDVLSQWLRVTLPDTADQTAWVSIMSGFTDVRGDVSKLPEISPRDWPELAFLRNCTYHELWILPVGLTLPPVYEFPNNDVRVNPGTYQILDVDIDGYPQVLETEISEGMTVEVQIDGLGEKKKCPPP